MKKKNQREIKGPRKVNTHAIIGKEKKTPRKNKAPDSQTSQATCQTKEIDRAHRSQSTCEAKHNEMNKKNQGSPIKTIKSHDSILVPLLGLCIYSLCNSERAIYHTGGVFSYLSHPLDLALEDSVGHMYGHHIYQVAEYGSTG